MATRKVINLEIAKARSYFKKAAKELGWDDDIRDACILDVTRAIRMGQARRAKVRKHDDARKLFTD